MRQLINHRLFFRFISGFYFCCQHPAAAQGEMKGGSVFLARCQPDVTFWLISVSSEAHLGLILNIFLIFYFLTSLRMLDVTTPDYPAHFNTFLKNTTTQLL